MDEEGSPRSLAPAFHSLRPAFLVLADNYIPDDTVKQQITDEYAREIMRFRRAAIFPMTLLSKRLWMH
jgi:hypothetical protein